MSKCFIAALLILIGQVGWAAETGCYSPKQIQELREAIEAYRQQDIRLSKLTIDELSKELSKPSPIDSPVLDWKLFVSERILRRLKPGETREKIVQLLGKPSDSKGDADTYLEAYVSSRPIDESALNRIRIRYENGVLVAATVMSTAQASPSDKTIELAK